MKGSSSSRNIYYKYLNFYILALFNHHAVHNNNVKFYGVLVAVVVVENDRGSINCCAGPTSDTPLDKD